MKRNKLILYAIAGFALACVVLFATKIGRTDLLGGVEGVRGKSPALPISDVMTPEETHAQDLALSDPRVQDLTVGRYSEVFAVKRVGMQFPKGSEACANADCRQVEIYLWAEDATVTVIVNVQTSEVLDVLYQPGVNPNVPVRWIQRAAEIIRDAPEVAEILGYQPSLEDIHPMEGDLLGTSCDGTHICASAIFQMGEHIIWATADLTNNNFAGVGWSPAPESEGSSILYTPQGCPVPGSVNRDNWTMSYETTPSDGLRAYNIAYNGVTVATGIKLVEWHADYGNSGYRDSTGCGGGGGGGFAIYPYGETAVNDLFDENENLIGFEVVQDFRMSNWGQGCNYRYDQHLQFFTDGRFRVVSGAYGKGCGSNSLYRPVVRIDMAVNGDANDNFDYYDGAQWVHLTNETYRVPYTESGHGPHAADENGYAWKVYDTDGSGYYMEMDAGQFGDGGLGDEPFVYATQHHANEGDTDMGVIGLCCLDNHEQGPHFYVNGESVENQNLVIWYVAQALTDAASPDYYCWTLQGEPNPVTYPCYMGPMFHPINNTPMGVTAGTISLQGRTDHSGAVVEATDGIDTFSAETDAAGSFSLDLPVGTYDISVEMEGYLDAQLSDVQVTEGNTTNLSAVTLPGGDFNDNDKVNIMDLAFIGSHYELECASIDWDARADINADCIVNLLDLTIASSNFQRTSPVTWE